MHVNEEGIKMNVKGKREQGPCFRAVKSYK